MRMAMAVLIILSIIDIVLTLAILFLIWSEAMDKIDRDGRP